jgi:hypothetical protein
MATDFKYASQSDLEMYYSASLPDAKRQIFGWTLLSSNKYVADNAGLVTQLFMDGADLGAAQSSADAVNSNYKWYYLASDDRLYLYNDSASPVDLIMEGGIDNATYFDQMLVNASMELNNLLDKRFATPIPKYTQFDGNTATASTSTEYDAIIIKATCYICVANLLRTNNDQEQADYYHNLITNIDGTGIVDRLNKGEYKLSFEVDAKDSKGKVRTITKTGTMDIVETAGDYVGEPFDILRITCTTAGAYGVAKCKVEYYGSNKLFGSEQTNNTVTGGLEDWGGLGGLRIRFSGAALAEDDQFEIEVYSKHRKITNAESSAIQLTRKGYGY